MGQLKFISPSNVLSLRVPGVGKCEQAPAAKANTYRPGDIEPPLPLTPEHLELIKSYAEHVLRGAEGSPASQIAHPFAPRAQEAPSSDPRLAAHTPSTVLASGIRRLIVVLVAVALVPNLTLAAFWLGLIDPPWSKPVPLPLAESHTPSVGSATVTPVLSAPDMLEATEGQEVTFPIALDGTDGVPPGSIIVIRGLPSGSTLSKGRPQGETEWDLKADEIGDLHLTPTAAGGGESKLTIQLVAPNNSILAEAATRLRIAPDPKANIAADADRSRAAEGRVSDMPEQEPQATVMEESAGNADTGTSMSGLPPLPIRRPSSSTNDDSQANWIRPSAYVNLRQSPSSSAPVVSVIAKGAKLRVRGRKRGWVQVTNPATSQGGWIYSGNIDTVR